MKYLLHISDLHLVENPQWNNMKNAILDNIRKKLDNVKKGDKLLVLGGDFHFYGKSFDEASKFLPCLFNAMEIDADKDVFLVPGNHDIKAVDKDRREDRIANISRNPASLKDRVKEFFPDYGEFCTFVRSLGIYPPETDEYDPVRVHVRTWRNQLHILHLNTTLIANGKTKKDQMLDANTATGELIRQSLREDGLPVIALGHNSFYDLHSSAQNLLRGVFYQESVSAYLCGDRHKRDTDEKKKVIELKRGTAAPKIPNIVCYRSSTDEHDKYSDFGMIWHIWDETKHEVQLEYLRWDENDQAELKSDGIDTYILKGKKSFDHSLLKNPHIDKVAKQAYERNMTSQVCDAILSQSEQLSETGFPFTDLCTYISNSREQYPLMIKGDPGYGKSTLMSSLYLVYLRNLSSPNKNAVIIIDTHSFDKYSIDKGKELLKKELAQIRNEVNNDTLFFIDGINEFQRNKQVLQKILLNEMFIWSKQGARFILSVGTDKKKELPVDQNTDQLNYFKKKCKTIIQLTPWDTNGRHIAKLIKTIYSLYCLKPNDKINSQAIPNFIHFYKLLDGNYVSFRTVIFLIKKYIQYKNNQLDEVFFSQSCGCLLLDYFSRFLGEGNLQILSRQTYAYLLNNNSSFPIGRKSTQYRSSAIRDFLFSYNFVSILKCSSESQKLDFILTQRINRFVLDILIRKENQLQITNRIIEIYNLNRGERFRTKSQLAYLLGRMDDSEAKKCATSFLLEQYSFYRERIDTISSNEVLLFRSIGISLLQLGNRDIRTDFLTKLIYNYHLRHVNRNFHVAYYTLSFNEINRYSLDDDSILTQDHYKYLISFLIRSITDKKISTASPPFVSILTLIDLEIWNYEYRFNESYNLSTDFLNILESVPDNNTLDDSSLTEYIANIKKLIVSQNIYSDLMEKMYLLKTTLRAGWLEEGRDLPVDKVKLPESVAEHTWACCLLAQIFLPENPQNCELLGLDSSNLQEAYCLDKIIQMLLIHDLPEAITGDIPTWKKTDEDRKNERALMEKLEARSVFRYLGQLRSIKGLWDEYHSNSINARIAQDIDRIEPLVQLFIYRNLLSAPDLIAERDSWIEYAKDRISTAFGKHLFNFINNNLLLDQYFSRPT